MARSPQQDLVVVVLLMVALGVGWYYTGGTQNDLARSNPLFSTPESGNPNMPLFIVPSVTQDEIRSTDTDPEPTFITNYLGTTEEVPSPYASFVSLEEGNAKSGVDSEHVIIRVSSNAPQSVSMAGWKLESTATGMSASIPQAAALPFLGSVNSVGPVTLGKGETAYVITSRTPNGTSFRTNICTGYFEQFQNFTPALKLECPSPQTESDAFFTTGSLTDECYNIVRTIPRCTLVVQSVPASAGAQCEQFISQRLSYNGCINAHKNDAGFYKDDWYLYMNRDQELWRSRSERVRLVDETGKVIDSVTY
jgi:hypothetical protein